MDCLVVAVGRVRGGPERALFDTYAGRSRWPLSLVEVEAKGRPDDLRAREGAALRRALPAGARTVALDETGRDMTSRALAALLGGWQDEGVRTTAFLIGGADGLDPAVRSAADLVLSLGRLTWPHLLVRPLIAEQVYRAQCILAGHPYHRD